MSVVAVLSWRNIPVVSYVWRHYFKSHFRQENYFTNSVVDDIFLKLCNLLNLIIYEKYPKLH